LSSTHRIVCILIVTFVWRVAQRAGMANDW
jgi:hypothetical protein